MGLIPISVTVNECNADRCAPVMIVRDAVEHANDFRDAKEISGVATTLTAQGSCDSETLMCSVMIKTPAPQGDGYFETSSPQVLTFSIDRKFLSAEFSTEPKAKLRLILPVVRTSGASISFVGEFNHDLKNPMFDARVTGAIEWKSGSATLTSGMRFGDPDGLALTVDAAFVEGSFGQQGHFGYHFVDRSFEFGVGMSYKISQYTIGIKFVRDERTHSTNGLLLLTVDF